ncbi:MAG: hypothetical protein KIT89_00530 [Microcella sp.]|uniref:hypothetical protein n=1 Tax=Microcella sp. TaxID=1913979 RepID=UPI0024CD7FE8|nr:hypothetical protein [Microcella sp.]UYN83770.1 MAG: hypothetical protein KIT89_00530 [Microcella sp.]
MTAQRAKCPRCGSTEVVPIIYGYPGSADRESAEAGRIVLGGCTVGERDPDPTHVCWRCEIEFDRATGTAYARPADDADWLE